MTIFSSLDAIHYMKNSTSQYSQAAKLLELIDINEKSSILDVGCGHGHIITELARIAHKGKSIGIDASKEMILLAKENFRNKPSANLQFFHIDAESMKFPKETFDLIICTNVLMWVRQPKKVLNLMISFLKPGGKIIIFTYPTGTAYVDLFEEVLRDLFPDLLNKSAVKTMMTPKQHKDTFTKKGLSVDLFSLEDIMFFYEDKDDFINYVKGWLACYAPLNEEMQEEFLSALYKKTVLKGFYTANGKIAIPHQTLKMVISKTTNS